MASSLVVSAGTARGAEQRAGVRIDALQPAAVTSPFLLVEGLPEVDATSGALAVGLAFDFALAPLSLTPATTTEPARIGHGQGDVAVVDQALLVHVRAAALPVPWLGLDVNVPVALLASGDDLDAGPSAAGFVTAAAPGVGEPRLGALLWPVRSSSLEIGTGARAFIPAGSESAYLADPASTMRFELVASLVAKTEKLGGGCTASVGPLAFAGRAGDRAALACAAHVKLGESLRLGLEPRIALFGHKKLDGSSGLDMLVEPLAAVGFARGALRGSLAGGPGFGSAPGAADVRAVASFGLVFGDSPQLVVAKGDPADLDPDLDGVKGEADACPNEAGPASARGCPALDTDGDGVLDADDACPSKAGLASASLPPKARGCPDGDNDGLADPVDACPTEPGAISPASPTQKPGCPRYARLGPQGFLVDPPVVFAHKSAELSPEARGALEEVAATMRANPDAGQVSVKLGTKDTPADLSDKRAQAIIVVFRSGYLKQERFEVLLDETLPAGAVVFRVVK